MKPIKVSTWSIRDANVIVWFFYVFHQRMLWFTEFLFFFTEFRSTKTYESYWLIRPDLYRVFFYRVFIWTLKFVFFLVVWRKWSIFFFVLFWHFRFVNRSAGVVPGRRLPILELWSRLSLSLSLSVFFFLSFFLSVFFFSTEFLLARWSIGGYPETHLGRRIFFLYFYLFFFSFLFKKKIILSPSIFRFFHPFFFVFFFCFSTLRASS